MLILQSQGNPIVSMLPLIGMVLVFYLLFMRPQQKKAKAQRSFSANMEKGEVVATGSGIIGKINKIEGDVVTLQLSDKNFIKIMRSAISKEMTDALDKTEHGRRL